MWVHIFCQMKTAKLEWKMPAPEYLHRAFFALYRIQIQPAARCSIFRFSAGWPGAHESRTLWPRIVWVNSALGSVGSLASHIAQSVFAYSKPFQSNDEAESLSFCDSGPKRDWFVHRTRCLISCTRGCKRNAIVCPPPQLHRRPFFRAPTPNFSISEWRTETLGLHQRTQGMCVCVSEYEAYITYLTIYHNFTLALICFNGLSIPALIFVIFGNSTELCQMCTVNLVYCTLYHQHPVQIYV